MKTLSAFVVLLGLAGLPFRADAQSVRLYDDFGTKFIDPDKWLVPQDCGDVNRGYRECVLEVKGGQLRQENRTYGDTDSDSGFNFSGVFLSVPNGATVTAIKADVLVKDFEVSGCANNPNVTGQTRARVGGSFFNTGATDVRATINLQQFPGAPKNTLRVDAFTDGIPGFIALGTISKGQAVSLAVSWEQANQRFKFTASAPTLPGQLTGFISYTVSDTTPPVDNFKGLMVNNIAPNCTSTPRPVAYMETLFDNVFVAP